jgi:hypothetical protein
VQVKRFVSGLWPGRAGGSTAGHMWCVIWKF